ncbi:hypothetical protein [Halopseudomonas bauzanensis]|uniref:hypothetical protein n=1 Tax=Halopseudomonas bauzanensis TaxID=653930 RepID=UPI0025560363|nr:hypothetical protein [Halopseudomonas bauzanensis]
MADENAANAWEVQASARTEVIRQRYCCELAPPIELVLDDPRGNISLLQTAQRPARKSGPGVE